MKLELIRTYFPNGTNGTIFLNGKILCYSIELPWHNNLSRISCIPEGTYELRKRYSPKYKWHLLLNNVPNRQLILIHVANDAKKELKGCIAPVSLLTAEGKGLESRIALKKINAIVFPELDQNKSRTPPSTSGTITSFLTIKS
ncbi:MAG: hypothetical protein IPL54_10415 [Chitinophagaceae bacterium]|nr:hypothetical protein [Chitinophagaceae bacterium]